jgi:hypothetical protein
MTIDAGSGGTPRLILLLGATISVTALVLSGCLFTASQTDDEDSSAGDTGRDIAPDIPDTGLDAVSQTDTDDGTSDTAGNDADAGGDAATGPQYPPFLRFTSGTTHRATGGDYQLHLTVESGMTAETMSGGNYEVKLAPIPAGPTN